LITELDLKLIALIQTIFDAAGWFGVSALMAFESATGLSPGEIVLGLSGWMLLAAHGAPASMILVAGLYTALGSLVGTSLTYWLVRLGGYPLVERAARWLRLNPRYLDHVEAQFNKWGPGLVCFGRMVPGIRILIAIPAGLARMNFFQFVFFSFIGAYVWCTGLIALGYFIGHELPFIVLLIKQYLPIFWISLVVLAVLFFFAHRLLSRRILARQALVVRERRK
jgi:membrane protein DedA with SNARE-associated domain